MKKHVALVILLLGCLSSAFLLGLSSRIEMFGLEGTTLEAARILVVLRLALGAGVFVSLQLNLLRGRHTNNVTAILLWLAVTILSFSIGWLVGAIIGFWNPIDVLAVAAVVLALLSLATCAIHRSKRAWSAATNTAWTAAMVTLGASATAGIWLADRFWHAWHHRGARAFMVMTAAVSFALATYQFGILPGIIVGGLVLAYVGGCKLGKHLSH